VRWAHKWGPHIDDLKGVEARTGKKPAPLRNMPRLIPENIPYWAAYTDLATSESPLIPFAEIRAYADLADLPRAELLVKITAIQDALNERSASKTGSGS
jgi:hypothetical protein